MKQAKAAARGMDTYHVIVHDTDEGLWGEVVELPGCRSQGATPAQLLENIRDAIDTWLDGAEQMGIPTPTATVWEIPA